MKTVVVIGSPNAKGQTRDLADFVVSNIGGDVVFIDVYKKNIKPCIDCRACYKTPGCAIKDDDMHLLYEAAETADNFIVASPIHFGNITGKLLVAFSRFQTYWSSKYIRKDFKAIMPKKKKGLFLMTSGTNWPNMNLIPEGSAHFIFDHINGENMGTIRAPRTDKLPVKDNAVVLEKARTLSLLLK